MDECSALEVPYIASPVPSYRSNLSENQQAPLWTRELANSLESRRRASRASSIVSTRTATSTNTALEDARSIDLEIDGVHFRINRDGSRITTSNFRDTLPPYSPQFRVEGFDDGSSGSRLGQDNGVVRSDTTQTTDMRSMTVPNLPPPRPQHSSHLDPGNPISNLPTSDSRATADASLGRNLSFTPGRETISVTKRRAISENDVPKITAIPRKPLDPSSHLCRRNGIRLPTLITNLTDGGNDYHPQSIESQSTFSKSTSPHARYPRSADPTLGNDNHSYLQTPRSPMFTGKNAPGLFTSPLAQTSSQPPPLPSLPSSPDDDTRTITANSPATIEEGFAETYPPPAMESENDISVHYTRLIRTIDRDHRRALHERDKEMASLRERLNEQDTIYRQQLRARDFIIDDLKSRITHLETTTEVAVERACHEVEDVWEGRWKERDFHLMERMRRIEAEMQIAVQRAVKERDGVWAKGWEAKYNRLMVRLEHADSVAHEVLERFDASPLSL